MIEILRAQRIVGTIPRPDRLGGEVAIRDSELPSTDGMVALEGAVEAYDAIAKREHLKTKLLGSYKTEGQTMRKEAAR